MAKNRFEMSLEAVNGGTNEVIVTEKKNRYDYVDGKRTSEVPIGMNIDVRLLDRLSPLSIKIDGSDPLPELSDEDIESACKEKKFIFLKIEDCKVVLYTTQNGQMAMSASCKSEAVSLLTASQKLKINT